MADSERNMRFVPIVSPEEAIKGFQKLAKSAQKVFDDLSLEEPTKEVQKFQANLGKTVSDAGRLKDKLEEIRKGTIPTEEFKNLSEELAESQKEADGLNRKLARMRDQGKENTSEFKKVSEQWQRAASKAEDLYETVEKLKANGGAFTVDEQAEKAATAALEAKNNQLRLQQEAIAAYQQKQSEAAQEAAQNIHKQVEAEAELARQMALTFIQGNQMDENLAEVLNRMKEIESELYTLDQVQKGLEQNNMGLGHEQYDQNLAKIRELENEYSQLGQQVDNYREQQANTSTKVNQGLDRNITKCKGLRESFVSVFGAIDQRIRTTILNAEKFERVLTRIQDGVEKVRSAFSRISAIFQRVKSIATKILGVFKQVGNALGNLISKFKRTGSSADGFLKKLNFGKILSYAIGIRGLFSVFSKLRGAITSTLSTMAQMNNGNNQANASISRLVSSLNLLKGALATAFLPILNVVSPILSNLMQQLANVITFIGMFIAKLTGAKSFTKAVFKSTNVGAGSGGSGKSAQEKYDEAVKKAQEKYDKKVAETEAKNAERMAKAEEKNAKAAEKYAKAQEKANNKLADFDDLNVLGVESLEELEEQEADLLEMPELELPSLEDFMDSGGGGASDPFGLVEVPLDGLEWNWDDIKAKAEELGRKLADMLNNFFADEDFAKNLGHNIAEALNTALHFAYGFIDELDWRQMGRWFGTLIQEGLETFEWDLLGKTIGELINGVADTIIGFFETYDVGTLGQSIATMINNAVATVDANKLGQAAHTLVNAFFGEIKAFFDELNIDELAEKITTFIKTAVEGTDGELIAESIKTALQKGFRLLYQVFKGTDFFWLGQKVGFIIKKIFEESEKDGSLAEDISDLIAAVINAALSFLQGLEWSGAIGEVKQFFEDIFTKSLEKVDTEYLKHKIFETLSKAFLGLGDLMHGLVGLGFGGPNDPTGNLDSMNELLDTVKEMNWQFDHGKVSVEEYNAKIDELAQKNPDLAVIYESYKKIESGTIDAKTATEELEVATKTTTNTIKENYSGVGAEVEGVTKTLVNSATEMDGKVKESEQNAKNYDTTTVEALGNIQTKFSEVALDFAGFTESIQTTLDTFTTMIDTWYQEIMLNYFGYDAWLLALQEGMLLAFTDFFTTYFFVTWDEQMQLWWDEHVLKWFKNDWWNEQVYTPWETFRNQKWEALMKWWDSMMKSWWDTKVVPWFKESKWETEFNHVYKVAEKVGEKTKNKISDLADETAEAVHNACNAMKDWIQEILDMLSEAIEKAEELASYAGGGGGGSSSGNGGGRGGSTSNGGGGGSGGFLPALNIMHFEDNLGMSAFKFPELATGAVIPPNNKFLAVLGDQKSGMNIETPLATMVEAFRSVMDEYMNPSMRNATMEVDGETFARLMMPHMMDEMNRLGYNTEIIEGM